MRDNARFEGVHPFGYTLNMKAEMLLPMQVLFPGAMAPLVIAGITGEGTLVPRGSAAIRLRLPRSHSVGTP